MLENVNESAHGAPGDDAVDNEVFLTREEFAKILDVSVRTVDNMRQAGLPSIKTNPAKRNSGVRIPKRRALRYLGR